MSQRPRTSNLRQRVGNLIKVLQDVSPKHRTPAMQRLLDDLMRAALEYDSQQQDGDHQ